MPQMKPIMWINMMFMITIILISMITALHFSLYYKSKTYIISHWTLPPTTSWKWKW